MKKVLLATTAIVAFAGVAAAQEVSGFVEFQAMYGENIDAGDDIADLEFGVDAQLNIRGSYATKAGLEYGYNIELDMYQQDGSNAVLADDLFVWVSSSFGRLDMGDAGVAGAASNQLHTPVLANAIEVTDYSASEDEIVKYSNSLMGFDVSVSTDDDGEWAAGLGYSMSLGAMTADVGVSFGEDQAAASLAVTSGAFSAGLNYAGSGASALGDYDGDFLVDGALDLRTAREYMAAGVGYDAGALQIGLGVENATVYYVDGATGLDTEAYDSRWHVGATYEVADGLTVGAGASVDDNDDVQAKAIVKVAF